jgi:hypothetical protein
VRVQQLSAAAQLPERTRQPDGGTPRCACIGARPAGTSPRRQARTATSHQEALMPWYIVIPGLLGACVLAFFLLLGVRIRMTAPAVQQRWHAAVAAELEARKVQINH